MSERNKAIVRRYIKEVWNRYELDRFEEFVAADVVHHDSSGDQGLEWMKETAAATLAAFPDLQTLIEDEIAEGDRVVQRQRTTGTHQGEFIGMPATGQCFDMASIWIFRLADGKIVEIWGQIDQVTMLQQLGVIPAPAEAAAG
jgi:steroid delta-isomerase-like uncharacterized protein